ncbi:MAG: DMT family transporter [Sphingorhabdus sp.]
MNHPTANDAAAKLAVEQLAGDVQPSPEYGLFHPRILIPFLLLALTWGSTWLVIRDQISVVPSSWSVSYRIAIATVGMFLLAKVMRLKLGMDGKAHGWAVIFGILQFMLNFNLVYAAEAYVTSGLVAVLFALLIVPNAVLGWLWLGKPVARSFWIGTLIAMAGVAMLILREYRAAPIGAAEVLIGTGLTLIAIISVSVANVLPASRRLNRYPVISVIAWGMLYGALFNVGWSLIFHGLPSWDARASYIGGVLYLAIIGSVVTFPLYFNLIRDIGPGRAAYTTVLIPVVAMLLSTLFEGYVWTALSAFGALLAMIGLLIAMQARKLPR